MWRIFVVRTKSRKEDIGTVIIAPEGALLETDEEEVLQEIEMQEDVAEVFQNLVGLLTAASIDGLVQMEGILHSVWKAKK